MSQAAAPPAPAPATPPHSQDGAAAPAAAARTEPAEQFFDAEEPPLPAAGMCFEDSALLYLRYMCRSGDQTVGLLQASAVLWFGVPQCRRTWAAGRAPLVSAPASEHPWCFVH